MGVGTVAQVLDDDGLAAIGAYDTGRNDGAHADADISHAQARARSLVIAAREDLQITRETRGVLAASR
jgi:hypothetical protein